MAGATLDEAAEDFVLVLKRCEVLSGVEEWWDSVGNCNIFPYRVTSSSREPMLIEWRPWLLRGW